MRITKLQKNVILYHHENFDGSGLFRKKASEIPVFSQLISFADILDTNFDLFSISNEKKEDIDKFVIENEDKLFSKDIVTAYKELSNSFLFWGDLEYFDEINPLEKILPDFSIEVSLQRFLSITKIFSKIIDGKSKFTAKHSVDLEQKSLKLVEYFGLDEETKLKIQIASNLHDIDKLGTPNSILDKEGSLTSNELFEIKKGIRLTKSDMVSGEIPFIGSTDSNNGLTALIGQDPIHKGNVLTLNYNGSVGECFYQPKDFWASDDVNVLYPKQSEFSRFNVYIALFFIPLIKVEQYRFNYGRKWHTERMKVS